MPMYVCIYIYTHTYIYMYVCIDTCIKVGERGRGRAAIEGAVILVLGRGLAFWYWDILGGPES